MENVDGNKAAFSDVKYFQAKNDPLAVAIAQRVHAMCPVPYGVFLSSLSLLATMMTAVLSQLAAPQWNILYTHPALRQDKLHRQINHFPSH